MTPRLLDFIFIFHSVSLLLISFSFFYRVLCYLFLLKIFGFERRIILHLDLKIFSFFFFEPTYSISLYKLVSLSSYFEKKQASYCAYFVILSNFLLLSVLYHCSLIKGLELYSRCYKYRKTESCASSITGRYFTNQGYQKTRY